MNRNKTILQMINKKIYYKREDNVLNHLRTYFQNDKINFSGKCFDDRFYIWRYSAWSGLFYSVIIGRLQLNDDKLKIVLKAKMNVVGFLLTILIFLGFFLGLPNIGSTIFTFNNILIHLFFAALPIILIMLGFFNQRKKDVDDIQNMLKNILLKTKER